MSKITAAETAGMVERFRYYAKEANSNVPAECIISPQGYEFEEWADALTAVQAERDALHVALADLLSWFPEKPSAPEWRLKAGEWGADDAVVAAFAAVQPKERNDD